MTQVFISYKSEYRDFANRLRNQLHAWDFATWMDVHNIPRGAYWPDEIDNGLRGSDVIIGLMAPEALESRNVKNEWDWALDNSKSLIPLLVKPCKDVPHRYVSINYIDFTKTESGGFAQLEDALAAPITRYLDDGVIKPSEGAQPEATKTQQTNYQVMLQKVHDYWIEGVLEKAEHNPLIDLQLAPPEKMLRHPDRPDFLLDADADILKVFDDSQRELLILGAPGAGKTTLMLQLARKLLKEAQANEKKPIPVVFNLSSWAANPEQSLADWLKDRLWQEYQVPKKVAERWVDNGNILPLLDGLDEVADNSRNACAEVINIFRKSHPFVDLVVCSRIKEYEKLDRLQLASVQLQPLSPEQIEAYVKGDDLEGLRELIATDAIVLEMAETPFLLNALAYSYRSLSATALDGLDTLEKRRNHLFNLYTEKRMAETTSDYTQHQARHNLTFLASKLVQHDQIVFYIENLQPTWLRTRHETFVYKLTFRLVGVVAGSLSFGLVSGVAGGLIGGPDFMVFFGLSSVLVVSLGALMLGKVSDELNLFETVTFSLGEYLQGLLARKSRVGLLLGQMYGIIFGLVGLLVGGLVLAIISGLVGLLVCGLIFTLLFGLSYGFHWDENIQSRIQPNSGIWRSAKNGLSVGFVMGIVAGTLGFLIGGLEQGLCVVDVSSNCGFNVLHWELGWTNLDIAFIFGVFAAISYWINYGGDPTILHGAIRLILYNSGSIPWNYAKFLDYCAEIGLLRKVGGGYIFVHRYLLEYFAGLDE